MKEMTIVPALCLDVDGTIRRSKTKEFIKDANDIELIPGIEKIIERYKANRYLIAAISNQGGVAFGFKTEDQIAEEWKATKALFKNSKLFNYSIMCVYMENGTIKPYNYRSLLRKPQIGMLALVEIRAKEKGIIIDWDNSLFIGDRPEDKECAERAKVTFYDIDYFLLKEHYF